MCASLKARERDRETDRHRQRETETETDGEAATIAFILILYFLILYMTSTTDVSLTTRNIKPGVCVINEELRPASCDVRSMKRNARKTFCGFDDRGQFTEMISRPRVTG